MTRDIAAKRYARAVFEIGVEKNTLAEMERELSALKDLRGQGHLEFLENPVFSQEEKIAVMDGLLLKRKTPMDFRNFVRILIEEKRSYAIPYIYEEFIEQLNEHNGREKAAVYSAVPLSHGQIESLKRALSRKRGKDLVLENVVDPDIVGGLRITVGSFLYDGSVKGMLEKLRHKGDSDGH